MKNSVKQYLFGAIKILIALCTFWFLIRELQKRDAILQWYSVKSTLATDKSILIFCLVILLMLVNWISESLKWSILINKIVLVPFYSAVKAVFAGITFSLFTPNRLGEPAGRMLFTPTNFRVKSVLAMSVGAISQMIITYGLGLIGLLFFNQNFAPDLGYKIYYLILILLIITVLTLIVYLNLNRIGDNLNRFSYFKKHKNLLSIYELYKISDLSKIFLIAFFRYCIYCLQYILLIYLFVPKVEITAILTIVPVLFMAQSIIPSFALTDLGIRGTLAIYFFSYITNQQMAVISAAFFLWFINIIIPSIVGCIFILKLKYKRVSYS